jgi:hypothetical protein
MKLALSIALVIALAPGAALAASSGAAPKDVAPNQAAKNASKPKDCQTIKSITVRQACLDREAAEHPSQTQQGNMSDAVDKMKNEDDLLARKLKSICRGC